MIHLNTFAPVQYRPISKMKISTDYNCPNNQAGGPCHAGIKDFNGGYVTSAAAPCPGQSTRSSAELTVGNDGQYLITLMDNNSNILPDITFGFYHDVGGGTDNYIGRYGNGYTIYLSGGNNNYYIGCPNGASGNFNVCVNALQTNFC